MVPHTRAPGHRNVQRIQKDADASLGRRRGDCARNGIQSLQHDRSDSRSERLPQELEPMAPLARLADDNQQKSTVPTARGWFEHAHLCCLLTLRFTVSRCPGATRHAVRVALREAAFVTGFGLLTWAASWLPAPPPAPLILSSRVEVQHGESTAPSVSTFTPANAWQSVGHRPLRAHDRRCLRTASREGGTVGVAAPHRPGDAPPTPTRTTVI